MTRASCSTSQTIRPPEPQSAKRWGTCSPARPTSYGEREEFALEDSAIEGQNLIASAAHNLSLDELAERLRRFGPLEEQACYSYVVATVALENGGMVQTASAPNFDGGLITLCTCKHSMRRQRKADAWRGVWVAGMSSSGVEFQNQQGLVYLMRVAEAYSSHFDLVSAFQNSGRGHVVATKAATSNRRGDVMIPRSAQLPPSEHLSASGYIPPMVGHAHRAKATHTYWENDVNHVSSKGVPAALLVGDPAFSFTWSKQMVRNMRPGALRPWRDWDLGNLLANLEDF